MKIATQILLFGQDRWIMKNIENTYLHVDRIYVAYSKLPWGYNPNARQVYTNSFDLNIIKQSKFIDKITIIEGDWLTEEAQRNSCVRKAKEDDMDYLIIQDADEFYFPADFNMMREYVNNNPNYDIYTCAWICFWKSLKYITVSNNLNKIIGYPNIIINLRKDIYFQNKRTPNSNYITRIPNVICYHAAYALTDAELKVKLKTWGHTNDFNVDYWYNNVWLNWYPEMINLHPVNPSAWYKAIEYTEELPEILKESNDNI
jgi:hypothetical protein